MRRDSCSSEAKSFAPLRGKPPYGAPKAPVESGGFLARHKCTRRPRARQCAGIRARVLRCRAMRRALPPCGASLLMARRNEKTRQKKNATFVSLQKTKVVSKTKVLKRKRQKIHISKHHVPICVARHKENVTDRSRTTERRDSCSSGARKPRQGMTPLKRCDIIDVWSIASRTYTDTMSCSAA